MTTGTKSLVATATGCTLSLRVINVARTPWVFGSVRLCISLQLQRYIATMTRWQYEMFDVQSEINVFRQQIGNNNGSGMSPWMIGFWFFFRDVFAKRERAACCFDRRKLTKIARDMPEDLRRAINLPWLFCFFPSFALTDITGPAIDLLHTNSFVISLVRNARDWFTHTSTPGFRSPVDFFSVRYFFFFFSLLSRLLDQVTFIRILRSLLSFVHFVPSRARSSLRSNFVYIHTHIQRCSARRPLPLLSPTSSDRVIDIGLDGPRVKSNTETRFDVESFSFLPSTFYVHYS